MARNIATKRPDQDQLIANGYKRAFSLNLFSNDYGLKVWERDSAMEWNSFLDVAKAYEVEKDNRQGNCLLLVMKVLRKSQQKMEYFISLFLK